MFYFKQLNIIYVTMYKTNCINLSAPERHDANLDAEQMAMLSPRAMTIFVLDRTIEDLEEAKVVELSDRERCAYEINKFSKSLTIHELKAMCKREMPYVLRQKEGIYEPRTIKIRIDNLLGKIDASSTEDIEYLKQSMIILKEDRLINAPVLRKVIKLCHNINYEYMEDDSRNDVISAINKVLRRNEGNSFNSDNIKNNTEELFDSIRYKYLRESVDIPWVMPRFLGEIKKELGEKYPESIEEGLFIPPEKTLFQKFHASFRQCMSCLFFCEMCDPPQDVVEEDLPYARQAFREYHRGSFSRPNGLRRQPTIRSSVELTDMPSEKRSEYGDEKNELSPSGIGVSQGFSGHQYRQPQRDPSSAIPRLLRGSALRGVPEEKESEYGEKRELSPLGVRMLRGFEPSGRHLIRHGSSSPTQLGTR